jgi:hypothetical protein
VSFYLKAASAGYKVVGGLANDLPVPTIFMSDCLGAVSLMASGLSVPKR